jgi:hypothetical protein
LSVYVRLAFLRLRGCLATWVIFGASIDCTLARAGEANGSFERNPIAMSTQSID